jgi:hypothetical protein
MKNWSSIDVGDFRLKSPHVESSLVWVNLWAIRQHFSRPMP